MDKLDMLLAIEAIKKLKARYFYTLDTKQWRDYGALFTQDAVIDFTSHIAAMHQAGLVDDLSDAAAWRLTGGDTLAAWIPTVLDDIDTVHHGHDPQITVLDADNARGIWSMYDRLEMPREVFHGYGHYHETYRRVDGEWYFSSLTLTRLKIVWQRRDLATSGRIEAIDLR